MGESLLDVFRSIVLHPLKFCKENEDWDGLGTLLGFGVLMLSLSIGLQVLRVLTTSLIRRVDVFVGLYSVFLFNLLLPIAIFVGLAAALHISLRLFDEPDIQSTLGALEVSSVVLVLWSAVQLIAVRTSLESALFLALPFLTFFWVFLLFQSFRYAHELDIETTALALGAPFMTATLLISLKPDLLVILDTLHDFAWKIPSYLGYSN